MHITKRSCKIGQKLFDLSEDKLGLTWGLGISQLRFSGEKVLFRWRAIAIFEDIDTSQLTANNFESV